MGAEKLAKVLSNDEQEPDGFTILKNYSENKSSGIKSSAVKVYSKPEEVEVKSPSFEDFLTASYREDFLTGNLYNKSQFMDTAFNTNPNDYDENFDASKDEELKELIMNSDPKTVETISQFAFNKEKWKELYNLSKEGEARERKIAEYMSANPVSGFLGQIGLNAFEPFNYLIPYGGIAKGISTITRGAINLNKFRAGMTASQALIRRIGLTALDTGVEEAVIQSLREQVNIRPVEDKSMMVTQAMLFGSLFAAAAGGVKGLMNNRTAMAKYNNTFVGIKEALIDETHLRKLDEYIKIEETKISQDGILNTKWRDLLVQEKEIFENIIKKRETAKAAKKYSEAVSDFQKNLEGVSLGTKVRETNILKETHKKQRMVIQKKIDSLLNDSKIAKDLKGKTGGAKYSKKHFKNYKKKVKNKVMKEYGAKLRDLDKKLYEGTQKLEMEHQSRLEANKTKKLPDNVQEAYKEFLEVSGHKPEDVSMDDIIDIASYRDSGKSVGAMKADIPFDRYAQESKLENFLIDNPEANKIMERYLNDDNRATQLAPDFLKWAFPKMTGGKINFDPNSGLGRLLVNKTAYSNNEIFSALYDFLAPSYGRKRGEFSVVELKEQLNSRYATRYSDIDKMLFNELGTEMKRPLSFFTLGEKQRYYRLLDEYLHAPERFENDTSISSGVKKAIKNAAKEMDKANKAIYDKAIEAGLISEDLFEFKERFSHRSWNNNLIREINSRIGTDALEELVTKAFVDFNAKLENPLPAGKIYDKVDKFLFGILNVDREDFGKTKSTANVLRKLKKQGVDSKIIDKKLEAFDERLIKKEFGLNGQRAPIDMSASIKVKNLDGNIEILSMIDLMHTNPLARQQDMVANLTGRIALAEKGIKNPDILIDLADKGVEMEAKRFGRDRADDIKKAIIADINSVIGLPVKKETVDNSWSHALDYLKTWNFNRVLQYAPISSFGELAAVGADVGYLNMGKQYLKALNNSLAKHFSLLTPDEITSEMTDALRPLMGVGYEDMNYNPLWSTSKAISQNSKGQIWERRLLGEAGRMTRMLTGIETFNRKVSANAIAMNSFNKIKNGKKASYFWGGITDTNLVEMGLGEFKGKKFVPNDAYKGIQKNMEFAEVDARGNLINFNFDKWDKDIRTSYINGLNKVLNHSLVNADRLTAKNWHHGAAGSLIMQFKSFEVNALSKVAGRTTINTGQAFKHGDYLEAIKIAQKAVYGTMFGKMALLATASVRYAGKDDYVERLTSYIYDENEGVSNFLTPLARTSAFTYLRWLEDFGLVGNVSTYGRSNTFNVFSYPMQSATGQLWSDLGKLSDNIGDGEGKEALKQAWNITPFARTPFLNIFFNMYSDSLK